MAHGRFKDDNIEDSFVSELVGLPVGKKRKKAAPRIRTNIDPTGFAEAGDISGFSTEAEIEAATKGIKGTGAKLASEFSGLRPKPKKITGLSSISEDAEPEKPGRGGFVSFTEGAKKTLPSAVANFGLPTDRMPSIEELGGALGGIARFVSQLSKRNRARGLSPGTSVTKTVDKGEAANRKTTLDTLIKLREGDIIAGNKEGAAQRTAQIDAIIQGRDAGAFDEAEDLEAIAGI